MAAALQVVLVVKFFRALPKVVKNAVGRSRDGKYMYNEITRMSKVCNRTIFPEVNEINRERHQEGKMRSEILIQNLNLSRFE